MPRIPLIEPEDASPEVRALYDRFLNNNVPLLNVTKLFGNHPDFLAGLVHIAGALYSNPQLSPRYRELAYLRASQLNSCHY
jgi:alkylhydroperoxidase family enzyme